MVIRLQGAQEAGRGGIGEGATEAPVDLRATLPTFQCVDAAAAGLTPAPSLLSTTDLWHMGGAIGRSPDESAAYAGRGVAFLFNPEANWRGSSQDEANFRWVREFHEAVAEYADVGMYLNFPGIHEGGAEAMRSTYGAKYDRLRAIKRAYDPDNVFRLNQNLEPGV